MPVPSTPEAQDLHREAQALIEQAAVQQAESSASSFALAAIRAIYSPRVERHASSNSSSATEEQRREGHHPGEERVKLVD
jgi:hypothetical protein